MAGFRLLENAYLLLATVFILLSGLCCQTVFAEQDNLIESFDLLMPDVVPKKVSRSLFNVSSF